MKININGEMVTDKIHKTELCNGNFNSNSITDKYCEVLDIQVDTAIKTVELIQEYVVSIVGLF